MRTRQFWGILVLLSIFVSALIYSALKPKTTTEVDPELHQARIFYDLQKIQYEQDKIRYEQDKLQLQRDTLERDDLVKFYGAISIIAAFNLSLLIIAGGLVRMKIKQASVYTAQIGQYSTLPVHYNDLRRLYRIAVNLSVAEIEAAASTSHAQAYQISRQMMEDVSNYTRALAGQRGLLPSSPAALGLGQTALSTTTILATPSFAELLRTGTLAPGKPLVLGFSQEMDFSQGQPQYRELQDLKSVAVAGWQGSGKTRSMAYLIASSVLAYGVRVYVIDPHKQHQESLGSLVQPLTQTGLVTVVNPFDTPTLIHDLNRMLDRRLAGEEPNTPGILLVIDELARLVKMDYFEELVRFLERCTEETRKANITFLGGSPKWTARHFKGRADIRGCMNSMLIHKTKPSQADLVLEDSQEKKLVKHLQRPGEAILATDYAPPVVVSMPYCCRQDMETVAEMVGARPGASQVDMTAPEANTTATDRPQPQRKAEPARKSKTATNMIFLGQHQHPADASELTVEQIRTHLQYRRQHETGFTQAEVARQAGMSPGLLSRILTGRSPLTAERKQKLYEVLFAAALNRVDAAKGA